MEKKRGERERKPEGKRRSPEFIFVIEGLGIRTSSIGVLSQWINSLHVYSLLKVSHLINE